jgi:hypothetical protein
MQNNLYCLNCLQPFQVPPSEIRRGGGKYCSPECYTAARRNRSPEERFWSNVDKNICLGDRCGCQKGLSHCWPWKKSTAKHRYGQFAFKGKWYNPSRLAFYFTYGYWPEPMGCHHCDNPPCCQPDHIYEGDWRQNAADAVERGQIRIGEISERQGERNGNSRLSEEQVREICSILFPSQRILAQRFGVSDGTISAIAAGKTWRHVVRRWLNERDG